MRKLFFALPILVALITLSCGSSDLKTGYININQVRAEYKLGVQYDQYLQKIENEVAAQLLQEQAFLNNIEDSLKTLQKSKGQEIPQIVLKDFYEKKMAFQQYQQIKLKAVEDSTLKYRSLLDADINQKVYQYGADNGYQYLFSPAGTGSFMYADSTLEVTDEVIRYLNGE